MGWLSIFKNRSDAAAATSAASPPSTDSVARARTRARQRLLGAIVLVVIGVIGFPLVFETRPRPIPVDVAIEIPRKETAAPLRVPPAPPPRAAASTASDDMVTESPADAGREIATPAPATAPVRPVPEAPAAATARPSSVDAPPATSAPASPKPAPTPAAATSKPPAPPEKTSASNDGARAKALLEGAATAAKPAGRFVVQVGAFSEAAAANELRGKAERLGLKTYTQVADTASGKRIRVRLGPFASRDEADGALAKARAGGLAGNVLAL